MSGRILVVDDNPLNVKLLAARLTREYYAVVTAGCGADALALAFKEPPDLVLLDVMMPDIDGYEVCRRLRADARTRHVPVIMVTALSDIEDRIKGLEAGGQDFLTKPIQDTALLARVRSLLRLKMVMDEWRLRQNTSNSLGVEAGKFDEDVDISAPSVLAVIDDMLELDQVRAALAPLGAHLTQVATTAEAAKEAALKQNYDLAICSLTLRQDDGLRICPELRGQEKTRYLPILLLGDQADQERVARGLDLGANDYLLRPIESVELAARVGNQVRFRRSYERLKQSYEQSLSLALTDPLTGVFNRRYFDYHLPQLLRRCFEVNKTLGLLVIDADHFKSVNDRFGHDAGDKVLQELALRLLNNLRPSDFVARYGGEEFVVVLPETDSPTAQSIGERLCEAVGKVPFVLPDPHGEQIVTISIGGAIMRANETPADLFKRADRAAYGAKQAGRDRVVFSP
ncbi:MAG: PleD family two-component system response regulator [Alphaproteobacteria bacterium]